MGTSAIISVSFPCNANDEVAKVAEKHLDLLEHATSPDFWQPRNYLSDLALRRGENPGPRGGMSQWGSVGKPVGINSFAYALDGFWSELLSREVEGGPSDQEKVVIFYQSEHDSHACCFEVGFSMDAQDILDKFLLEHGRAPDSANPGESLPPLEYKYFELPFTWWHGY